MAQLKKETTLNGVNILDFFYPIGTVYYTVDDSFNPNTSFGGEWTKIEGRFVYGRESSQKSEVTGGEKEHTLTISEMPSHNHKFERITGSAGNMYGYAVGSSTTSAWSTNHPLAMNNTGGGGISQQYATLHHCQYLEEDCLKLFIILSLIKFFLLFLIIERKF